MDGWADGHLRPTLLGGLGGVDLIMHDNYAGLVHILLYEITINLQIYAAGSSSALHMYAHS